MKFYKTIVVLEKIMAKKKKSNKIIGVLPEKFEIRLKELVPNPITLIQVTKGFQERPTTFRVNTLKSNTQEVLQILNQNGFKVQNQVWSNLAFVLLNKSKKELMELPIYTEGKIYIQSFASQIPPLILDPQPNESVFDVTAAPGSKTSQMAAMMQNTGELIANDINKVRFFKLKHNLEHLGVLNCTIKLEDGSRLAGFPENNEKFDKILLDAPCSAEARFVIGNIKTFGFWSEKKIKAMADKQRKLIFSAFRALKPNGVLVYSTCTISPEENELLIAKFLSKHPNAKLLPVSLPGVEKLEIPLEFRGKQIPEEVIKNSFRLKPTNQIEGFFIAKIQKISETL